MRGLLVALTRWNGRIGRKQFWGALVVLIALQFGLTVLLIAIGLGQVETVSGTTTLSTGEVQSFTSSQWLLNPWGSLLLTLVLLYPYMAVAVKRRHDRDTPGYDIYAVVILVVLAQVLAALGIADQFRVMVAVVVSIWMIVLFILLGCLRGTIGPNRYGPDPLGATQPS